MFAERYESLPLAEVDLHVPVLDLHGAVALQVEVHLEGAVPQLRLVADLAGKAVLCGDLQVLAEDRLVVRVGALLDDALGPLLRSHAAEVGQTLLGNDAVQVMLGVVDVGAVRHHAGDTVRVGLGRTARRGVHDLQEAVTEEVAGTAEAVDHPGTADQRGVGVGVDVDLNRGVHGDAPEATDRLRGVGNGERTKGALAEVLVPVLEEAREARALGERQGAGRSGIALAGIKKIQNGVLQNLGENGQVVEGPLGQTADDGVGNGSDARLDRKEVLGETAGLHFMGEEVDEVVGDCLGGVVLLGKGTPLVTELGLDHGNDLARIARNVGCADPFVSLGDADDLTIGRILADNDVVNPFEGRLAGVHLDDDPVALHQDLGDDAAGGGGNQAAVLGDGGNFDNAQIETASLAVLGVETVAQILREEREVLVTHPDAAFVDAGGDVLAGLVRPAAVDHVEGGPAVLGLGPDGGADEEVKLPLPLQVVLLHVVGQRNGHHLGVTGRGESGPAEVHARLEELDGLLGSHDLAEQ